MTVVSVSARAMNIHKSLRRHALCVFNGSVVIDQSELRAPWLRVICNASVQWSLFSVKSNCPNKNGGPCVRAPPLQKTSTQLYQEGSRLSPDPDKHTFPRHGVCLNEWQNDRARDHAPQVPRASKKHDAEGIHLSLFLFICKLETEANCV